MFDIFEALQYFVNSASMGFIKGGPNITTLAVWPIGWIISSIFWPLSTMKICLNSKTTPKVVYANF